MSNPILVIGSAKKVSAAIVKAANSPDHSTRITSFSAVSGEAGEPIVAAVFDQVPLAGYEGRITGGKVLISKADKAQEKLDEYLKENPNATVKASALVNQFPKMKPIKEKTAPAAPAEGQSPSENHTQATAQLMAVDTLLITLILHH